jgi:thiol-disulfide isomerase/thioredoxin
MLAAVVAARLAAVATLLAAKPTPAPAPAVAVTVAEAPAIMEAVKAPGATAVLVNVWATWCEPCREEMPDLVRFYREHRGKGLRLVMVSADDEDQAATVARVLAEEGLDGKAFIKTGSDAAFIDSFDPKWRGALPATFLFDGKGIRRHSWLGPVTYQSLRSRVVELLSPADKKPAKK